MSPVRLALTLGDANGIGPEIALKALNMTPWPDGLRLTLVGQFDVVAATARRLRLPLPQEVTEPDAIHADRVAVWAPPGVPSVRLRPGQVAVDAGRASAAWVEAAVEGWRRRWWSGVVTGPISKEAWALAEIGAPGHTELLARLCKVGEVGMLLCGGRLRVLLVTRHLPLRDVPPAITRSALRSAFRLATCALRWLRLRGEIAVCGLNPHAGDGGALGREEVDVIAPAIRAARRAGLPVSGPWSADSVFHAALRRRFAMVIAMYHDQGLGPLKTVAMDEGVNLTLGLPFVRTSPDHGTAMDIAGRGCARAGSMAAAIRLAATLARRPNPWASPS